MTMGYQIWNGERRVCISDEEGNRLEMENILHKTNHDIICIILPRPHICDVHFNNDYQCPICRNWFKGTTIKTCANCRRDNL